MELPGGDEVVSTRAGYMLFPWSLAPSSTSSLSRISAAPVPLKLLPCLSTRQLEDEDGWVLRLLRCLHGHPVWCMRLHGVRLLPCLLLILHDLGWCGYRIQGHHGHARYLRAERRWSDGVLQRRYCRFRSCAGWRLRMH
jgi:hypothetical protein